MSTLIHGWPQPIASARWAHLTPTPEKDNNTCSSQGNSPPYSATIRRAMA